MAMPSSGEQRSSYAFPETRKGKEDRFAEKVMEALACVDPALKPVHEATGMTRLAEAKDDATRRKIIKDVRKQAKEARNSLGWS